VLKAKEDSVEPKMKGTNNQASVEGEGHFLRGRKKGRPDQHGLRTMQKPDDIKGHSKGQNSKG